MAQLGGMFGIIGVLCIIYLVLRPILQAVVDSIRKNGKTVPTPLKKVSQFVTRTHRYAGIIAVVAVLLHFILQYTNYGFIPVAGFIACLTLTVQAVLGLLLSKQKDKESRKKLALAHRVLGFVLVVAVVIHRL